MHFAAGGCWTTLLFSDSTKAARSLVQLQGMPSADHFEQNELAVGSHWFHITLPDTVDRLTRAPGLVAVHAGWEGSSSDLLRLEPFPYLPATFACHSAQRCCAVVSARGYIIQL